MSERFFGIYLDDSKRSIRPVILDNHGNEVREGTRNWNTTILIEDEDYVHPLINFVFARPYKNINGNNSFNNEAGDIIGLEKDSETDFVAKYDYNNRAKYPRERLSEN